MVLLTDESSNMVIGIKPDPKNTSGSIGSVGKIVLKCCVVLTLEGEESQKHGERRLDGNQPIPRQGEK